jgi:hypothetical protein
MSNPVRSVETYYTLIEAVERFFTGGHITVRSLRTEIKKGRLRVSEVAGKFLFSESVIAEMLEASQPCHAHESRQGSISNDESPPRQNTWIIRDGEVEVSTGCGADDHRGAGECLARYIAQKYKPLGAIAPSELYVDEVIAPSLN